ncbi:cell division protein [uncultured Bifidobacterium sp.]|uniref:cell division protein n=1 Tax=uncultured Bifidobacterium sp. TaxID=165187 RepID=UPI0028DC01DF|nr:cell division protein [uncultured Bifidobacterium sp.]
MADDDADDDTADNTAQRRIAVDPQSEPHDAPEASETAANHGRHTRAGSATRPAAEPAQGGSLASDAGAAPSPSIERSRVMEELPDLQEGRDGASDDRDDNSREEFTTVYDIIDGLQGMLEDARGSLLFPGTARVDRQEFEDRLSHLKDLLPVQLERASALMREAERRLDNAQNQASAIVTSAQSKSQEMVRQAQEQAEFLTGQQNVTDMARRRARAILDAAQARADHLTHGADDYCTRVMSSLQEQVGKIDHDIQTGLHVLQERRDQAGAEMPHLSDDDYPDE